ncbi:rod-binding protein [Thalassococcus sp. BH17M4-6]|uniref:rod-binding protein n=1 Tax=Thalassococcus sp. BH17M4-6 TaxID=3413148 RepID=UPI003BD3D98D
MPRMEISPATTAPPALRDRQLREAAKELEAGFLAEMLKSSGLGKVSDGFGGGIGEDQFASFLVTEQARAMVDSGGIGLAETLYHSLKARDHG